MRLSDYVCPRESQSERDRKRVNEDLIEAEIRFLLRITEPRLKQNNLIAAAVIVTSSDKIGNR